MNPLFFRFLMLLWMPGIIHYNTTQAQVTGPEQDCAGAIPLCENVFIQNTSYIGIGDVDDLNPNNSCLQNAENNSVWYTFTIADSGIIEFSIIPQSADDYDFALYKLNGHTCADIYNGGLEVRCSYAFTTGATGLKSGYTDSIASPQDSARFLAPLHVLAGETYALVIDNFSSSADGYSLDFTRSTATMPVSPIPEIDSLLPLACDSTSSLTLLFSEPVQVSSLNPDGSNFSITGPSAVAVTGVTVADSQSLYTGQILIGFSAPIAVAGTYSLVFDPTSSAGTVADRCGTPLSPDTLSFNSPAGISADFGYDCSGAPTINFTSLHHANILSFLWSFGDGSTSTAADPAHLYQPGQYTVSLIVNSSGCSDTASTSVFVGSSSGAHFSYTPTVPYKFDVVNFTNQSIPGAVYQWTFGDGGSSGQISPQHTYTQPGSYTVCLYVSAVVCYSDTFCQEIQILDSPVSVPNVSSDAPSIQTFPNPTSSEVQVQLMNFREAIGEAILYNFLGESISIGRFSSEIFNLDLTGLPPGVYLLKVRTKSGFQVKEIVKL